MQSLKFGFVAAAMLCALWAPAQAADCTRVAALGQMVTHDTAVLFSNNALKKYHRFERPCRAGTREDDLRR